MDTKELIEKITLVVEDYLDAPEAWEDPNLTIDTTNFDIDIAEEDDLDSLPENIDSYAMMDLVEMDADGNWKIDAENIASVAEEYTV